MTVVTESESLLAPTAKDWHGRRAIEAVIFEGGGTKGMVYAGCIERLEEAGILESVKFFAGSSAGSQIAALLGAGYSGKELKQILSKAPWHKLLDGNEGCCGCMAGLHRLWRRKGYFKGDFLERYVDELLSRKLGKKRITFREFHTQTGKALRLGVCNIATRRFEFLDHISSPDVAIAEAVRASSSMPLVYVPKVINGVHYVDGGTQGNLPATAFGLKHGIAFHLMSGPKFKAAERSQESPPPEPPKTFMSFLESVLDMLLSSVNLESAEAIESMRRTDAAAMQGEGMNVLKINTHHHGVLETSLTEEQIDRLIQSGTDAADQFLAHFRAHRGLLS